MEGGQEHNEAEVQGASGREAGGSGKEGWQGTTLHRSRFGSMVGGKGERQAGVKGTTLHRVKPGT